MVLTGHLMDEYFSSRALRQNGHPLKVLQEFSLPGIDDIFTPDDLKGVEWLTYGTGMYAIEKRGNKGGAAELFAIGPTDMPYESCAGRYGWRRASGRTATLCSRHSTRAATP